MQLISIAIYQFSKPIYLVNDFVHFFILLTLLAAYCRKMQRCSSSGNVNQLSGNCFDLGVCFNTHRLCRHCLDSTFFSTDNMKAIKCSIKTEYSAIVVAPDEDCCHNTVHLHIPQIHPGEHASFQKLNFLIDNVTEIVTNTILV